MTVERGQMNNEGNMDSRLGRCIASYLRDIERRRKGTEAGDLVFISCHWLVSALGGIDKFDLDKPFW